MPLHPWKFPDVPWERLYIDLAGPFMGFTWLVVENAYSKWPEVRTATSATALMKVFAVEELSEPLVSDNGSQLILEEFKEFCKFRGINYCYVTMVRLRDLFKLSRRCVIKMAKNSKNIDYNVNKFLHTNRVTAHATTNVSPSQFLLGRKVRTRLDLIQNDNGENRSVIKERAQKSQEKQPIMMVQRRCESLK